MWQWSADVMRLPDMETFQSSAQILKEFQFPNLSFVLIWVRPPVKVKDTFKHLSQTTNHFTLPIWLLNTFGSFSPSSSTSWWSCRVFTKSNPLHLKSVVFKINRKETYDFFSFSLSSLVNFSPILLNVSSEALTLRISDWLPRDVRVLKQKIYISTSHKKDPVYKEFQRQNINWFQS